MNTNRHNSKDKSQRVASEHITPVVLEVTDPGESTEPAQHDNDELDDVADGPRASPGHAAF